MRELLALHPINNSGSLDEKPVAKLIKKSY